MKNNILINTTLVLLTTTILFGVGLSSNSASATSASTALASVKVAASCTLTTSGGGNYSAIVPNGTSAEIAGSTMSVSCNDAGGFALYAVGYSDDTIGNNNMIGSSTNIPTNTSGTNSYWAMKINPTSGNTPTIENSFNNYHIIPDSHTKIASYASSTGTGSLSVNATYKANISSTQLAGNYLGKVKYTLIHPAAGPAPVAPLSSSDCPALSICYAPNADDIEGTMLGTEFSPVAASTKAGRQTGVSSNSTVVLSAYNYSRSGYGFAGWSTEFDATNATNPTIYGPNQTLTTSTNSTGDVDVSQNGLILYPVWVASEGSIQNWTGCNGLTSTSYDATTGGFIATLNSVTALTDQRDGNTYAIAKLSDDNCWMIENLRINAEDTGGNVNQALAQGYADGSASNYGKFIGLAKSETTNFTNVESSNSVYSTNNTTEINIGTGSNPYLRLPRYNNSNTDRSLPVSSKGSGNNQWYGYGNYYNWPAAMANTIDYENDSSTDVNGKTSDTVNTSICPSGWRLPYGKASGNGSTSGGFSYLDTQMGGSGSAGIAGSDDARIRSERWRKFPNNYIYAGRYRYNSPSNRNSAGYYWTSTASYMARTGFLVLEYSKLFPGVTDSYDYGIKYEGYPIRCVRL